MNKIQRSRIAEIIPEESPFFGMYTGDSTTEDLFKKDAEIFSPPNFGDSLRIYNISSGLDIGEIGRRAGIPVKTNLITKLMNHSSAPPYRERLPSISSNYFFSLGTSRKIGEGIGRILMLFYKEGLLMLKGKNRGISAVDEAIKYLSEKGNTDYSKLWRRNYLNDLLAEISGNDKRLDFSKKEVRIRRIIRNVEETHGLVPVYLVPCLSREELEVKRDLISEHIERLSDLRENAQKTEVEMVKVTD